MKVTWDEQLGKTYHCDKCNTDIDIQFDSQQTNSTERHSSDLQQQKEE